MKHYSYAKTTALMCGAAFIMINLTSNRAFSAPTVTGTKDCIVKSGGNTYHTSSRGGSDDHYAGSGTCRTGSNQWPSGTGQSRSDVYNEANFVTADEVMRVINQVVNIIDQRTHGDGGAKDRDQDGRLNGHDKDISDLRDKVKEQDGNKTAVVIVNDGTGNAVQLGNVASGKTGNDAVNVDQLNGTLAGLGGGAKVEADGTVTKPTYNIGGANYDNVVNALKAHGDLSVQYVADENGKPTNKIILTRNGGAVSSGSGTVALRNVSDCVNDSDAATYPQVKQSYSDSKDYTDQQVNNLRESSNEKFSALNGGLAEVRKESRAGIASAMAAAGLRL